MLLLLRVIRVYLRSFDRLLVIAAALALLVISAAVAGTVNGSSPANVSSRSPQRWAGPATNDTRVGTNLDDIGPAGSSGVVFVDAMKQAAAWSSNAEPLVRDDAGNVRALRPGQVAQTGIYQGANYPAGDYTLLYDGRGAFDFSAVGGTAVASGPGRVVLRIVPRGAGIHLRLMSTDSANYVRNVRLVLPGFLATYKAEPFYPLFIQRLRAFNVLRFKDWMHGDTFVASVNWGQRPALARFTQASPDGVALEYMIALANATGADPWFTLPMGATNYYIYSFAQLVHQRLNPSLRAYFEYGHEVSRTGTPANTYAAMAAQNVRLGAAPAAAALDWYALRSAQAFDIAKHAFGADAARAIGVLSGPLAGSPTAKEALIDQTIMLYAGAATHADVFAISAQNDGGLAESPSAAVARIGASGALAALDANVGASGALTRGIAYTATLAQAVHLPLVAYDGGDALEPGLFGAAAVPLAGVGRLPAMRQIYHDALESWHAAGGSLYVSKALIRASSLTQSAGLLEQLDQPSSTAYKLLGVQDYVLRHPATRDALLFAGRPAPESNLRRNSATVAPNAVTEVVPPISAGCTAATGCATPALPWVFDTDFVKGAVSKGTTHPITINAALDPNPAPQSVYQHSRVSSGGLVYTLPNIAAGSYTLYLHFCEYIYGGAGLRTFNVSITDGGGTRQVLTNFDIFGTAGGKYVGIAQGFPVTPDASGNVTVSLKSVVASAILNGVELVGTGTTPPTPPPTPAPADYLMYHGNLQGTGWNRNEPTLNTTTVRSMGTKWTWPVDGSVNAQPLYVAQFPIGGQLHNVVVIATEHNSVYAFDADALPVNGVPSAPLWKTTIGTDRGLTSQAAADVGCLDIQPEYGITGTPVIVRNGTSATIYVVGAMETATKTLSTEIHAINLATGSDSHATMAPTWTLSNGTTTSTKGFVSGQQMNRAGLMYANGTVYAAFGSHCDSHTSSTYGWLLAYNTALSYVGEWVTSEDVDNGTSSGPPASGKHQMAGIWGSGTAPVMDASGNIVTVTGNGTFDANLSFYGNFPGTNYGQSVIKLNPSLCPPNSGAGSGCTPVGGYFTISNFASNNAADLDFGSGGVMVLPQNLAVAMGKDANLYLLNTNALGGLESGTTGLQLNVCSVNGRSGCTGVFGGPAYYQAPSGQQYVYYATDHDVLRSYLLNTSAPSLTFAAAGTAQSGYGGVSPIVTSNGSTAGTGLVWAILRPRPTGGIDCAVTVSASCNVVLQAYDATTLGAPLFSATAGAWTMTNNNAFISPLVAAGKAYVAASKTVTVFGP